ncbi:MAG: AAA family ATPase, partial [Bacteroidota bacterium]|nr:AAA family ATPase [Bacteroidota bacterium]
MTQRKRIELGYSDFKEFMLSNNYFVDKTMLIYELFWQGAYISLIPRPKRFGKTLNLSMIEHFFDIQKPESAKFFDDFEITKHKDFCKEHQNKYPVINISLKSIKETNWNSCLNKFKGLVSDLYKKNKYLLKSDKLEKEEKQLFNNIILETANTTKYKESLLKLSQYLRKHFNQKVVILIDEYDAPIITAFNNTNNPIKSIDKEKKTYYEEVINFMQGFLGDAYKGNDINLKKGFLTGVMRVGKESIFSEWNNFHVYGTTIPYFSDKFGFTQQETEKILTYFGLDNKISDVKKWYDGYQFGKTAQIYNPWSVVSYIANKESGFKPYWVNSGDYSLIKNRILELGVKDSIKNLIEGKTIDKELKDNFVFQDFETDNELLWTLLTYNGYLTQAGESKYGNYKMKIPNNEIKIVFTDIIMTWLNREVKIKRDLLISTAEDLINNRIKDFEIGFKKIIGDTISYFDTANKTVETNGVSETIITNSQPRFFGEQIYHVYILGLLAILTDDYIIKSNR